MAAPPRQSLADAVEGFVDNLLKTYFPRSGRGGQEEVEACLQIANAAHTRVSAIFTRRNSFSPIHRLPTELLAEILSLSLITDGWKRTYYEDLAKVRRVCRRWRDFIDASPQFWTRIAYSDPPWVWNQALTKSREAPLSLEPGWPNLDVPLHLLLPHIHRCKRLHILLQTPTGMPTPRDLLCNASTRLEHLSVHATSSMAAGSDINHITEIIQERELHPSSLALSGISGLSVGPLVAQLRSLHLAWIPLQFNVLLGIMSSSPDLESLHLSRTTLQMPPLDTFSPNEPFIQKVRLEKLATLHLTMQAGSLDAILRRIDTPHIKRTELVATYLPVGSLNTLVSDILGQSFEHMSDAILRSGKATLSSSGYQLQAGNCTFDFSDMGAADVPFSSLLDTIPSQVRLKLGFLAITEELHHSGTLFTEELCNTFPNVTTFTVYWAYASNRQDILPKLRKQQVTSFSIFTLPVWLWPHLQEIIVLGPESGRWPCYGGHRTRALRKILNIVKERKAARDDQDAASPAEIQTVRLTGDFDLKGKEMRLLKMITRLTPKVMLNGEQNFEKDL